MPAYRWTCAACGVLTGDAAVAAQPDLGAFDVLGRPLLAVVRWLGAAALWS